MNYWLIGTIAGGAGLWALCFIYLPEVAAALMLSALAVALWSSYDDD